jgi:hypothetical protein
MCKQVQNSMHSKARQQTEATGFLHDVTASPSGKDAPGTNYMAGEGGGTKYVVGVAVALQGM